MTEPWGPSRWPAQGAFRPEEITVFDSTGMVVQGCGSAATVYESAIASGAGSTMNFFA
jgi:ornithine cyclodeaminase/alanine dehydrogenase-like protein (mu-crystallin family)